MVGTASAIYNFSFLIYQYYIKYNLRMQKTSHSQPSSSSWYPPDRSTSGPARSIPPTARSSAKSTHVVPVLFPSVVPWASRFPVF